MLIAKNDLINVMMLVMAGILFFSCGESRHPHQDPKLDPGLYQEPLIKANKQVARNEDDLINDFIARYGWQMVKTGTGLRYMIYYNGSGVRVQEGDAVKINYSVMLLNGDSIYTSHKEGPMEFVIGVHKVESGLEEGILLLHRGDKAKFILPSHLAFGLLGDLNKIPQKATLVYDVEILEIKRK
jgi:FKBP-type peptidyl-prolyl cis-trans isomerase